MTITRKIPAVLALSVAVAALSGCVVTPAPYAGEYVAPPGVVYVAPTYASPGVGWVWMYHPHYGWGWHHPRYGWHRGWR